MAQDGKARGDEGSGDDLEPYRRLVELQRQMTKLAQRHEVSRRELEVLRERVAREVVADLRGKRTWSEKVRTALPPLLPFARKKSLPG